MSKPTTIPQDTRPASAEERHSKAVSAVQKPNGDMPLREEMSRMADEGGAQPQGTVPPSYRGE